MGRLPTIRQAALPLLLCCAGAMAAVVAAAPHSSDHEIAGRAVAQAVSGAIDPRRFGAKGDGQTDDTAAIQAAVDAAAAVPYGGIVRLSPGKYCIKHGPVVLRTAGMRLDGQSESTALAACGADNTLVEMTFGNEQVTNLTLFGKGATGDRSGGFGATKPVVLVAGSQCAQCLLDNLWIDGGANAVAFIDAGEPFIYRVFTWHTYQAAFYFHGSSGWLERVKLDNAWPVTVPGFGAAADAWRPNTRYAAGAVAKLDGYLLQCAKSGSSGSSPPSLADYGVAIPDGTAQWLLAGNADGAALQMDTGSTEVYGHHVDLTGAANHAVALTNTQNGAAPRFFRCDGCVLSQTVGDALHLPVGSDVYLVDNEIGGGFTAGAAAIATSGSFAGNLTVHGGWVAGYQYGIKLGAGTQQIISSVRVAAAGAAVSVAASDVVISGNILGGGGIGVEVMPGPFDYYNIVNNICGATAKECVADHGLGRHKTVSGNN